MQCKFNKFKKKSDNKTAYNLSEGQPIFSDTVYLLPPFYIRKGSAEFTLVNKGKHISSFFKVSDKAYLGDFKSNALVIFIGENNLDLFQINSNTATIRQMLIKGQLNEIFYEARKEATT